MSEYAATFDLVDSDDDGLISAGELVRLMEVLGERITVESAQAVIDKVDTDGDGLINIDEFGAWLQSGRPLA
ncbi:EF-hand domain-containing protein [Microtetraspora fusca]|uniref:EF-hand domain-containing protein n=1 Tax=Microtetraspora fusca TaxID=1997 RepID=A0ABW6V378_MICFU|nr:EF-hand domain-containing protein [Microtetraspora fusca]